MLKFKLATNVQSPKIVIIATIIDVFSFHLLSILKYLPRWTLFASEILQETGVFKVPSPSSFILAWLFRQPWTSSSLIELTRRRPTGLLSQESEC